MLRLLEKYMPRRLVTRIILAMMVIVVLAGMITTVTVNRVMAKTLEEELIISGQTITTSLGENLVNALLDGDMATVQEMLDSAKANNSDVEYAFAYGPDTPLVHTFPDGFPGDLLITTIDVRETPGRGLLLSTEKGLVRHFGYHPLDGLSLAVHMGISQGRILHEQRRVTQFVVWLTMGGCLAAAAVTYGLSRFATRPLADLTSRVQLLGRGRLDERIDITTGDEVGDLARAFNTMANEIQQAIHQLRVSQAGYRDLLSAASAVGEGIALISDQGPGEGTFLFVNETFAQLTGCSIQDLLGTSAGSVLHHDSLETARRDWETIRSTSSPPTSSELVLVDRYGKTHILETAGTLIEYQGQRALAWFTRDISQRKQREKEIQQRNRELTALNAVALAVSEPLSPAEVLSRTLNQALTALGLNVGWVFTLTPNGEVGLVACQGLDGWQPEIKFPACQCGSILRDGKAQVVQFCDDRCTTYSLRNGSSTAVTCHASVPLQVHGHTLGVLSVASPRKDQFRQPELNLLSAIGQQMGIALENARLWEELRQKEHLRGELLARAIHAQEEERQRLARELHDATGQSLNALVIGLNALVSALEKSPEMVEQMAERLRVSTSDAVSELQRIIYDLRPSLLDDLGLIPALRWYAQERLQARNIQVFLDVAGEPQRLPEEVETALFRIGQEAISNISRHAHAQQVHISVNFHVDQVKIEVSDDGVGFDPSSELDDPNCRRGLGLLGMKERASLLGGEMAVRSSQGQGTILEFMIPLKIFEPIEGKQR